jgi:hypothetical protein
MASSDASITRKRVPDTPLQTPSAVRDTHDDRDEIPNTRPPYLLFIPTLVIAFLTYWALHTTSHITSASYIASEATRQSIRP